MCLIAIRSHDLDGFFYCPAQLFGFSDQLDLFPGKNLPNFRAAAAARNFSDG